MATHLPRVRFGSGLTLSSAIGFGFGFHIKPVVAYPRPICNPLDMPPPVEPPASQHRQTVSAAVTFGFELRFADLWAVRCESPLKRITPQGRPALRGAALRARALSPSATEPASWSQPIRVAVPGACARGARRLSESPADPPRCVPIAVICRELNRPQAAFGSYLAMDTLALG